MRQLLRRRLRWEQLEERLALSIDTLHVGGLSFVASEVFTQNGSQYTADAGSVSIGYEPTHSEDFLALVQVDLTSQPGAKLVVFDTAAPRFTLQHSTLDLVVVGGSPNVPIPIWQTSGDAVQTFGIAQLVGNGVQLDISGAKPMEVAKVDFSLTKILFANPGSGDTSNAQVKMQGNASFANVPLVSELDVIAEVDGTNFVVADTSGIQLTGLNVTKNLPSNAKVAGLELSGSVTIGYSHTNDSFTFGGTVSLTSKEQDGGHTGLKNVSAGLDLTIHNGQVSKLGFEIGGSFEIFALSVSTDPAQPLSFEYNVNHEQYEIGGRLKLQFHGNTIDANFGSESVPGIVIKDGELTQIDATVTADFHLFGADIKTRPSLSFSYNRSEQQFEMYGGLGMTVSDTVITAQLGTQSNPGLLIQNGDLKQLNLGISGRFSVFGLQVLVNKAHIEWKSDGDVLVVGGDFEADFEAFKVDLNLGSDSNPGLSIKDGHFQVGGIKVTMTNAEFGAFTVEKLVVAWARDGENFDLDITVDLTFASGFTVGGSLDFQDGKLNDISFQWQDLTEPFAVGDTGLFLTDIDASVKNLLHPSQLVVSGTVAFNFGETLKVGTTDVNLFRVEGDFTVDAKELILEADAWLGAFSPDQGSTWEGLLGKGDAKMTLDWAGGIYSLHVEVDGLAEIFDLTGDFTFATGRDIRFLAEVDAVIPQIVPFIGGKHLGGLGFLFDHTLRNPVTTTLAAWTELHVIWDVEVGFEVVFDAQGDKTDRLIGAATIDGFKKDTHPPVDHTYTYSADLQGLVPANATSATLHANWSKAAAGVTILGRPKFRVEHTLDGQTSTYTEDQFAAHGIALIHDPKFETPTSKAIQIVGSSSDRYAPLQGNYKLLIDIVSQGGNPFPHFAETGNFPDVLAVQATNHIPKPIFGQKGSSQPYAPTVPPTPTHTFGVTLNGNMDEGFLVADQGQVSLYRVLVQDPNQRPVLVGTATPTQTSGSGVNWQADFEVPIDDLYPLAYALYAVVSDGFNVPVKSALSDPFTPAFAVQGSAATHLDDALAGWSVFLDYNQNGVHEANEPITQTSNPDGFYAFAPSFDSSTGWSPVPVGTPFDVRLIVPSDQFVPDENPITISYDGSDTKVVNFDVQEKTAIKGVVFVDQGNDGKPADGVPLAGATVYLDTNGNGVRDADEPTQVTGSDGSYAFRKLEAGTYTVGLDTHAKAPAAAYVVPASTVANFHGNVALGMAFDVHSPIDVTSLGVFDSGADGLEGALTAILYDRVTRTAVAKLDFTPDDQGTLIGGSRFKTLAEPITLYAGFQGLIVAESHITALTWGVNDTTNPPWTVNQGSNQLTFTGTGVVGNPGEYPTIVGGNHSSHPYAAGTFLFTDPIRTQTSPESKTYVVTVDNSGFDVKSGNDFGVQPLSTISGTITARKRNEGQLGPATPQSGVTVHLVHNGYVAGSTVTGHGGNYNFSALRPGTYSVEQLVPSGYRQTTPFVSGLQLKTPGSDDTFPESSTQRALFAADFDGNGVLDLAAADDHLNLWIVLNGDFTNWVGFSLLPTTSDVIAIAAANWDGALPDLVILFEDGQLNLLENSQDSGAPFLVDDGPLWLPELPRISNTTVYLNLVTGTFVVGDTLPNQLAAVWFDYDSSTAGVVTFSPNADHVSTTFPGLGVAKAVAGDFNRDGITDLFLSNESGHPIIAYGNGKGGFSTVKVVDLPAGWAPVVGDIDGDGRLDVGLFSIGSDSNPDGNFHYALQDESGDFTRVFSTSIAFAGFALETAALQDVDGDFRPDLIFIASPQFEASLYVARNTGTVGNWFTPAERMAMHLGPVSFGAQMATGDPAGDGLANIGIIHPDKRTLELVRNVTELQAPPSIPVEIQPAHSVTGANFVNVQLPKSIDHVLSMPPDIGAGEWTISVHGDRLEVRDSDFGLWDSRLLNDMRSLTIAGIDGRPSHLTIDMSEAAIALPGGIFFQGGGTTQDTLRILLGDEDDVVTVGENGAMIHELLPVTWTYVADLTIEAGDGDDTLSVSGTPAVGVITLNGGLGDDTYILATRNSTIHIHDSAGIDTLDFSGATSGVAVNLALSRGQPQRIDDTGNRLHLHGVIENLIGSDFADRLWGNAADNLIIGGAGNDRIWGRAGHDILDGGEGNDFLFGGLGDDLLIGGPGRDRLFGGAGRDVLIPDTTAPDDEEGLFDDDAIDELFDGLGSDLFLDFPTNPLLKGNGKK